MGDGEREGWMGEEVVGTGKAHLFDHSLIV